MQVRIQRKRVKGWKSPEGARYVGRPTKYGNPFLVKLWGLERSLILYRQAVSGYWDPKLVKDLTDDEVHEIYVAHIAFAKRFGGGAHVESRIKHELGGADLMCWCPLDEKCHADILLEIANS